ncbi:ADENOSINE/GUANOSINE DIPHOSPHATASE [Salix viminalis]|uniref:ADENOSINE/GUANOSINE DIPHOSPHATASE n=1 Tax=Salix viminalis TaxID=40686 RepID=A0A9Q0TC02_SALVM|nr:ADENOSINE/GUANOSINE DIPHOSPHATASE [Salix viminalis]
MKARPGLGGFVEDPDNAGGLIEGLVEFAKKRVPRREWGNAGVQLMVSGEEMVGTNGTHVIEEEERGVYSWVAVNYVHGTMGSEPHKTTGVVELGRNSLQITFASREAAQVQSSRRIKLAGVTYNLQAQSLPNFGQDTVWESLHERHSSRNMGSSLVYRDGFVVNPCIPKGYDMSYNINKRNACVLLVTSSPLFSRSYKASLFLKTTCSMLLSFLGWFLGFLCLSWRQLGNTTVKIDWDKLKDQHHSIDDLDLMRYCFSSAYTVALLHNSLGVSMDDKRIGFANNTEGVPFDWTLGALIFQSMLEPLESEINNLDEIVGNESVTYFSLFAILLIALLASFFCITIAKTTVENYI